MRHYVPMADCDEFDALTRWRQYLHFKPGTRKWIKRRYNKRERRYLNTTATDGW